MGRWPVILILFSVAAVSCGDARDTLEPRDLSGVPAGPAGTASTLPLEECNRCHGSDVNAAPPNSVLGATSTDDPRVGAHQQHLQDLTLRAPLACDECHRVPRTVNEPGHGDNGIGDVVFDSPGSSGLARTGGAEPQYDRATATCSGVYCHTATHPEDGRHTAPVWTVVDGTQQSCLSCHGFPPAPSTGHPASLECLRCHPGTMRPDGTIDVEAGRHIDGVVQIGIGG